MSSNRARQARSQASQPARQASQPARSRPRQPRPLPKGDTLFTPDASPARTSIEQRSATPLLWLHQLPSWLPPVLAAALLVTGFAVPGWGGAAALCAVAAVLAWLAALSWPRLSAQGRLLRIAAVAAVLAVALIRALHHA